MAKTIGMAAATFLAVCGAFAALGDTVEEREKRTDEIAQWLPAEPKADGAFDARDFSAKEMTYGADSDTIDAKISAACVVGGSRAVTLGRNPDRPDGAWCGMCREHSDGRGYTFEYAMEWVAAGITPPKPGETRPNNWNIHFSNVCGMSCCGQIIENVLPDSQKRIGQSQLAYLYRSPLGQDGVRVECKM